MAVGVAPPLTELAQALETLLRPQVAAVVVALRAAVAVGETGELETPRLVETIRRLFPLERPSALVFREAMAEEAR